ncbi:MAG: hypothetical protein HFI75_15320 [Lachnospiraceae bacterium]|nr:hypothetical protein [Lachnospiraceae bacterium]
MNVMENTRFICYNIFRKTWVEVDGMGFWVGAWLHDVPDTEYNASGKRAVVKHLCFGPLETRIWYKVLNGQYCCEIHFIEGMQAEESFTDFISKAEMLEVIEAEIVLCKEYNETELAVLFQAEKEKINSEFNLGSSQLM